MKKYIGKKWKQLTKEEQNMLLSKATPFECSTGECIIDLTENLSVTGEVIDTEEERYIEIDDDAIIYNPKEGIIIENIKFKDLISLKDASIMLNKDESKLRRDIKKGFFKEYQDCIKLGKQWVFDIKALEKKYKEYDKFKKDLEEYC